VKAELDQGEGKPPSQLSGGDEAIQPRRGLQPGDVLRRDLVHPASGQILLPAGSALSKSYVFKIELLGLVDQALACLADDSETEQLDREPVGFVDYSLFMRLKSGMIELEAAAQAYRTPAERKLANPHRLRNVLGDMTDQILARMAKILPSQYLDLRLYDYCLYAHPLNTATLALAMGMALGYDRGRMQALGAGALLADIGKFRISADLLHRRGELTAPERSSLMAHVDLGLAFVGGFSWATGHILSIIENHHERFDGSGYPRGLAGKHVPEEAQIVGLADAYDAMISDLPYRSRIDLAVAYRVIDSQTGSKWSPEVVWAFKRYVAPFPVGTIVRLNTGEEGRVLEVSPSNLLRPVVLVDGEDVDLAKDPERRITGSLVRRAFFRERISLPVEIRIADHGVFSATLADLSLNGLALESAAADPAIGAEVEVTIALPARKVTLAIRGHVVWVRKGEGNSAATQFGVAFSEISTSNKERLLAALWGNRNRQTCQTSA
jgi:HD-GYP domain-containing protein (c-di-GMP phosphodiesterase class II)/Tfp pilus assembly protein PilZ